MSEKYDVIVVGAGNAGLVAAATTAKNGLKTLLLEKHNLPGGWRTCNTDTSIPVPRSPSAMSKSTCRLSASSVSMNRNIITENREYQVAV